MLIGSCISIFGCALQAGAATVGMLIAGRVFAGIAVGLLAAVVPMYCVSLLPCPAPYIFSSLTLAGPKVGDL